MHQLLSRKFKVALVALPVLALALVPGWVGGEWVIPLGVLIAIVDVLAGIVAVHSWSLLSKVPIKPQWMTDLSGEWAGEIHSQWRAHSDDPQLPPIPCSVTISQKWSGISFTLKTDEIVSRSSGSIPMFDADRNCLTIKYFYETDPKAAFRQENPPQSGCAYVTVDFSKSDTMHIRYTNDRGLGGDINLIRVNSHAGSRLDQVA